MKASPTQAVRAIALLATMMFLLVASSFHSGEDNDAASFAGTVEASGLMTAASAPDRCPACTLDGMLLARLSLALPLDRPAAVEPLAIQHPATPFVAPRTEIDSRPPPQLS